MSTIWKIAIIFAVFLLIDILGHICFKIKRKIGDYLMLVIAKKMFHIDCDLYILAQSIGLVLFEKEPINEIFKRNKSNKNVRNDGQLYLWPDFSGQ